MSSSDNRAPVLHMTDVHFRYRSPSNPTVHEKPSETNTGDTAALAAINFTLRAGRMLALMGESGSGKSTVARLACGLLKPGEGTVFHVPAAYVAQDPGANVIGETVWDDVALGWMSVPGDNGAQQGRVTLHARAREALSLVDMAWAKQRAMNTLSGGEVQRTALAAALAAHRRLLVLDEPTSHLSAPDATAFWHALQLMRKERHPGILLVTHQPWEAMQADELIVMHKGRIAVKGPPRLLLRHPALMELLQLRLDALESVAGVLEQRVPGLRIVFPATPEDVATVCPWPFSSPGEPSYGEQRPHQWEERRPLPDGKKRRQGESPSPLLYMDDARFRHMENASCSVQPGEAVAIVGKSGTGKNSVLLAAGGLIDVEGTVQMNGRDVARWRRRDPKAFHATMGMALQFPERSFFAATVYDEIAFTARLLKRTPSDIDADIRRWCGLLGLDEHLLTRSPFTLSGGEKRRVALLSAMIHRPKLLLFDEPDAGLDWKGKRYVAQMIQLLKKAGVAVVVATHDVTWAFQWADDVLVAEGGTLHDDHRLSQLQALYLDGGRGDALCNVLRQGGVDVADPYVDEGQFWRRIATVAG